MKPLLSIVIPTKNRQKYAFSTIKSILSITHSSLELVVHDNSDSNNLEKKLSEFIKDSRLVYRYNNSPLSTIHNFDYAMQFVNGEYVCFIGDDDGINPEIMRIIEWANKNDLDAIVPSNPVTYSWPSSKNSGELNIYPFTGKVSKVDVGKNLNIFLNSGAVYYLNYGLPKAYHGIVKKECFDQVYNKLGYYFGGLSPDIFASISISSFYPKKVISIDYPITIAGSSYESDLTHRTDEAKNKKLSNAPHFNNRGPYKWSNSVPSIYSGSSIWAESGIHALEDLSRFDLIYKINKYKMVAEISIDSPKNEKLMLDTFLNPNKYMTIQLIYHFKKNKMRFEKILKKIINKLFNILSRKKNIVFNDIDSIDIALREMNKYINKNDVGISCLLKDNYYE
jgi:glycosyltransferase involved in cell wall biosynthesis